MPITKTGLLSTLNRIWKELGRDKYAMYLVERLPNQRLTVEFRLKEG